MADPDSSPITSEILTLTAQIVVAHVAANEVPAADVPALINAVYGALIHADAPKVQPQEPAVPIKRSIQRDYLICLEDGAKLKLMKRYLTRFGLTPETYRAKWGLPLNYPMVAPSFSAQQSAVAKRLGLGAALIKARKGKSAPAEIELAPPMVPVEPEVEHTAELRPVAKQTRLTGNKKSAKATS